MNKHTHTQITPAKFGMVWYAGWVLFIASYGQVLLTNAAASRNILTLFQLFFLVGLTGIGEGLTQRFAGYSFVAMLRRHKMVIAYMLIAAAMGLLIEGFGQWMGKLWVYPYFSRINYFSAVVTGYVLCWLMLIELYLGVKALVDHYRIIRMPRVTLPVGKGALYQCIGAMGVIAVATSLILTWRTYHMTGGYFFEARNPMIYHGNFFVIILGFFGIGLISEYIAYRRGRSSFLQSALDGYAAPLLTLIATDTLLGLAMELPNVPHKYWLYTNWLLQNKMFFGVPIAVLVVWSLAFVPFIVLIHALLPKDLTFFWGPTNEIESKEKPAALSK